MERRDRGETIHAAAVDALPPVTDRPIQPGAAGTASTRRSGAEYKDLVERLPAVVYRCAATLVPSRLTYISPQVESLLGYPVERWLEDPLFWIGATHPDDLERVLVEDERSTPTDLPFSMEYRLVAEERSGRLGSGRGDPRPRW